jgi:hypothetical protein
MKRFKLVIGLIVATSLMAVTAPLAVAAGPRWATCFKKAGGPWKNSVCTEAGSGEWETREIKETVEVTSSGKLELEDNAATGGKIVVECEETDRGTVGAEGQDSVTSVTVGGCAFITAGECEASGKPVAQAVNLPWSTRLEERENTETHKKELRDLVRSVTTKPPGWHVECEVKKIIKIADECTGGTNTAVRSNRATGAVESVFDSVSAQEPGSCTEGNSTSGRVRGTVISKYRSGALWTSPPGSGAPPPPAPRTEWVDFTNNQNVILDHRKKVTHKEIEEKIGSNEVLETAMPIENYEDIPGEGEDSVEWKSPKSGEVTKDWPIAYAQGATMDLKVRIAVEPATKAFLEESAAEGPLVTGETTVGGVDITFQKSVPLEEVKDQLKEHDKYFETALTTSAALPKEVSYEKITIKWKWKIKEKGAEPVEQTLGTSTHNLYKTYAEAAAGTKFYFTLLALETENIEKESKKPTEAQVVAGIWKGFTFKETEGGEEVLTTRVRIYDPADGDIETGERLWYYQNLPSVNENLKEYLRIQSRTVIFAARRNTVPLLLAALTGECGAWQKAFAKSLKMEGITTYENQILVVKYSNGGSCEVEETCGMLVDKWEFVTEKVGFTYEETQVKDLKGIAGQGVANPLSFFGNHQIVDYGGKLYDPSYGTTANSELEYQEKSIAGFCEVVGMEYKCSKPPAELVLSFKKEEEETE